MVCTCMCIRTYVFDSTFHYRDYLDKDMSRTKVIISYLPPLLALEDSALEQFVTRLV